MADVTKGIRGYGTDTREYAANTRIDIRATSIFGHTRVYPSSRGIIKGYQSSHKYSQIRGLDIRQYADIRGHHDILSSLKIGCVVTVTPTSHADHAL